MTWFRIDDQFVDHPKVVALRAHKGWHRALALWTLAGTWSARQLTDGLVPAHMVQILGCTKADALALVRVKLWVEEADGYRFHDFNKMNPTREHVQSEREKTRKRVAKWKAERKGNGVTAPHVREGNAVTTAYHGDTGNAAVTVPPTRPDPARSTSNPHHDHSSGCADAPAPAGMVDPMARARSLLVQGYQRRYRQAARDAWMGLARAHTDIGTVAAWCAAKPEQIERRVNALLDGVFADEWMTTNRWPWGNIARDPARWARSTSDAKPDEPTPYQRLLRKLDLAEQRGDWDAIDRIRAELNAMAGAP